MKPKRSKAGSPDPKTLVEDLEGMICPDTTDSNFGFHRITDVRIEITDVQFCAVNDIHPKRPNQANEIATPDKTPADCHPVSSIDVADLDKARLKTLRAIYPKTFKVYDRLRQATSPNQKVRLNEEMKDAFLIDAAAITGTNIDESHRSSTAFIIEMAKAFEKSKRRKKDSPANRAKFEIAKNWFKEGYCFMNKEQFASAINKKLGTSFKPGTLFKLRSRALTLVSKRREGHP